MAIAGRVAIVPKGDWSANATYKRLDAVTYNNTLYFAKKNVPAGTVTSNTEYWSRSIVGSAVTVDDTISSESTNPVQNKVIKAYVDKEVSENVVFSTSTSKLLNGSIEAQLVLSNATRNLINPTLVTAIINGVTYTNNGDGTYTLNGTATKLIDLDLTTSLTIENGKEYSMCFASPSSDVKIYLMNGQNATEAYGSHPTLFKYIDKTNSNKVVHLVINSGYVCNNLIVKPMLTTDLDATCDDFVPYSGYDIKTIGKNLLDLKSKGKDTYTNAGITYTKQSDGSYKRTGKATAAPANIWMFGGYKVTPNGTNHLLTLKKGHTYYINDCAVFSMVNGNEWAANDRNEDVKHLVTPSQDVYVTGIRDHGIDKGSVYNDTVYPGVFEADRDLGWSPYAESTVHIDSAVEFPLLGLKSFNGVTNIISPGNVEVIYAKSEIGAALLGTSENKLDKDDIVNNQTTTEEGFVLDARQANPNIKGSLGAQIKAINDMLNTKKIPSFAIENIFTGNPFCVVIGTTDLASFSGTKWEPDNGGYHVEDIKYPAGGQVNVTVYFTLTAHSIVIIDVNTLNGEKIDVQGSCISYNFTDSPKNDNISIQFAGRNSNTTLSTIRYMPLVIHLA